MIEEKKTEEKEVEKNKGGRPQKYTPESLLKKSKEYFNKCEETIISFDKNTGATVKKPKTLSGLCLWLGVAKDYISEKAKDNNFSETISILRLEVENNIEEGILTNTYHGTSGIFNLKNNFNWVDKSEVDNKISGELKTEVTDSQAQLIANRILNGQRDNTSITTTK